MKTYLALMSAFFLCATLCSAQTNDKKQRNALSLELGKTGFIYNLNFDHKAASNNFGYRLGAGSNFGKYLNAISFGGGAYHLTGGKNKFFELGVDIQYLIVDEVSDDQKGFAVLSVYPNYTVSTFYPSLNLGYRRYGKNNLFRAGLSPGMIKIKLIAGGYISYGLTL